jgi:D-glycero-D-manno-heptose 1,7-bisphosphate phosphatase
MNKAVFLDRDGVIIQEPPHYVHKPDQVKLIHGSIGAIKLLNENNFKVIVISNQAGVAYGYYLEKDVLLFNQLMKKELELYSAKIDAIYYCPHHPEAKIEKYRIDCNCRKPKPGMLKRSEIDLNIDLKLSFMVGDKKSDIDAGKIAGCKTILVLTGHGIEESKQNNIKYDFVANDIYSAVEHILTICK